jgi:hypothetical protein
MTHRTIWSIKNRWLRATVTWLVVIGCAVLCLIVAPIALVVLAIIGMASGVAGFFRGMHREIREGAGEWRAFCRTAWAAMTGKDAPV